MDFQEKRGIGYCGLVCVLCSDKDCPGCVSKGVGDGDCSVGKCAAEKGIDGCHACPEYPCEEKMLQGKKNKAFNRYTQEFGRQALIDRLYVNYHNGILYHRPDHSPGDYDVLETEDEIYSLLRYGGNDPYVESPEFETAHFYLRQVCEEDGEELLQSYYNDVSEWMFYANGDRRIFSSPYPSLEEMKKLIDFWLVEYRNRVYVRFTVIDKETKKAIGTIEVCDYIDMSYALDDLRLCARLHIDLSTPYETREYISELLALADKDFFQLFGFKYLLIRAVPDAKERISALVDAGYQIFKERPEDEHYYIKGILK